MGYILVNWTGEPQTVGLARQAGELAIVAEAGSTPLAPEAVKLGWLHLTVPARSARLVEQKLPSWGA